MIRTKHLLWGCYTLYLVSCSTPAEQTQPAPKRVEVSEVQQLPYESVERSYPFLSQPYRTVDLSFRVGGPVDRFVAQSGSFYRKGDVIAAIDPRDFLIRQAEAEAVLRQADAEFQRISTLFAQDNISGSAYEKAQADRVRAKAAYDRAVNDLHDTRLLAPFDGFVQVIHLEEHQEVKPAVPVLSLIDLSKIKIEVYVPEDVANAFHRPQDIPCRISFDGLDGTTFEASETYLSQTAMDDHISFLLTVLVDNPSQQLFGGMSGNVILPYLPVTDRPRICVPQSAVFQQVSHQAAVWKLTRENQVERTAVELGDVCGSHQIEILSGLQAGDRIVTSGIYTLTDQELISPL